MQHADHKEAILTAAEHLGFRRPGVTALEALPRRAYFEDWLAQGRAGDMRYLEHHKKARLDPRTRFPWARSILSASFPYLPPAAAPVAWRDEMRGRIAAYALGPDYHRVVAERLALWARAIEELIPGCRTRTYVDTGAVFEHEWAARAGVGWTGKHTLTLDRDGGSWGFLGEILIDLELDPDEKAIEHCGTCTRCIDVCPTEAIRGPADLDPRLCLSYLTIESRGAIPRGLRTKTGEWIFGCDLCQIVCPWNAPGDYDAALHPPLAGILALDEAGFARRFADTSLERTGLVRLQRNAAVVAGNTGNPAILPALADALQNPAPLVREHAAWAIGQLAGETPRRREYLDRAARDDDPSVVAEARHTLDHLLSPAPDDSRS
ncbi:MAG: tRNA epoxyqueuosine(34) reductase QueG [Deltaproteobacteria bacterium]